MTKCLILKLCLALYHLHKKEAENGALASSRSSRSPSQLWSQTKMQTEKPRWRLAPSQVHTSSVLLGTSSWAPKTLSVYNSLIRVRPESH